MDYNWCHGPKCHTHKTQDRIRGVKGSKVLRTRKIPQNSWNQRTVWSHFCSQGCLMDFITHHCAEFIEERYPSTECLETPINDPKKTTHNNGYYNWNDWDITVDESRQS